MTAVAPDARPLVGRCVRLDPTVADDDAALFAALDDERVWASGYGGGPAGRRQDVAAMRVWTAEGERLRAETGYPALRVMYTVRLVGDGPRGRDGTVVGTTSIGDVLLGDEKAHIGWTGYGPSWWGGVVNPECKLLLLSHLFEDCAMGRVKLQTDNLNTRSQAAIAKLGAVREGVLRRHKARADGTFRDTVVYSVLRDEWPSVRDGLRARVEALA